jgi:protein-histidine pros-kinase
MITRLQTLSWWAAVGVMLVAGLVIVEWLLNVEIFRSLLPGLANMKFNTALAFVLAGIALLNLRTQPQITQVMAVLIVLVGLLTLGEYLFERNIGIDEWLVRDTARIQTTYPGRMSPIAAVNFVLVGSALLLLVRTRRYVLAHILILAALCFVLIAVIGYLYDITSLYRIGTSSSTALHTAVTFVMLCLGILAALPDRGFATYFTADSAGGYMVRRLLPAAILVPFVFGWLRWQGELQGWYDAAFGLALFTVINIATLSLLIMWTTTIIHKLDVERKDTLHSLHQSHALLEARVQERTVELSTANEVLKEEIDRRKRAEEQFRDLVESAPDALIIVDEAGKIVIVNAQTEKFFGYNRDELLGRAIEMLIPEAQHNHHIGHRAQYMADPHARTMGTGMEQLYGRRKDGSLFPVEISISPIKTSEGTWVSCDIRDITARIQAEAALQESEKLYQELFNQIADAIFIHDEKGNILDVNRAASERLGYTRDELLRMRTIDIDAPDYGSQFASRLQQQLNQGKLLEIEGAHVHRNGTLIPILVNSTRILYKGQVAILAVVRDITERKQAEQQALELAREQERVGIISAFIRDASHDFRTPLTIISNSFYLLSKAADPEKRERYLVQIEQQISRITRLVDRLLIMVQLDSQSALPLQPLDLKHLVTEICVSVEHEAQEKSIQLVCALHESSLIVQAADDELRLALAELLQNAIRYTPSGGTIAIRTAQQDQQAVIEVRDNGIGIASQDLPYIFQRLYRVDTSRSSETGGTGLGLSIAKRIIDLHGGQLLVESKLGEGSVFRVLLPLSQD